MMGMKTGIFELLTVVFAFTTFAILSPALAGPINIKGSGSNDAKVKIDSVEGDHPSVNFLDDGKQKGVVGWYRTEDAMKFIYSTTLSSSNGITLKPNGNVGIGTSVPSVPLTISKAFPAIALSQSGSGTYDQAFINLLTLDKSGDIGYFDTGDKGWHLSARNNNYTDQQNDLILFKYDSEWKAVVYCDFSTGNVGIGTEPSYKLHVNGDAAGTSWTNLSSREYKADIQKVDETAHPIMLSQLMAMDLTTYKYKQEYGGDGEVKLGFIAEDMPEEVLSKNGKGVDLYELLTLTIGAMKAQQGEIRFQQKEITEQRRENEALNAKLSEVIARLEALENSTAKLE